MSHRTKHYVTFYSPGTFFSETSTREIGSWDIQEAIIMSRGIIERYNAKPFAFSFSTQIEADAIPDGQGGTMNVQPKTTASSGKYFLGGTVMTLEEVPDTDENSTLRSNMQGNDIAAVVENRNSWRSVQPFEMGDVVLNVVTGEIVERGDSDRLTAIHQRLEVERETLLAKYKAEYEAENGAGSSGTQG